MNKRKFLGILIIVVGLLLSGNIFEIWNIEILSKGWWTMVIIIPALGELYVKNYRVGVMSLLIGLFLLFFTGGYITLKFLVPLIFIVSGLSMILPRQTRAINQHLKLDPKEALVQASNKNDVD